MQFLATDQLSACETRQKGLIQIIELLMVLPAAAAQPSQGRLQLRAQNCAILLKSITVVDVEGCASLLRVYPNVLHILQL